MIFSLNTTLPHNLIKEKVLDLIEKTSIRRKVSYTLLVRYTLIRKRFLLLQTIIEDITFGLVRIYLTPYRFSLTIFILDLAIFILDLAQVCRQIVGIPMGTNCAPLVADFFLFYQGKNPTKTFLMIISPALLRQSTQRHDI